MNKHLIILGIAVLLLTVGLSGCIESNENEDTQSDEDGNTEPDEENFDIQKAIDNASAGSTIYVEEGIYREIIHIDKEINLTGDGMPFLNPVSEKNSYALRITAMGVKLSGFNIRNDGAGLYTSGIRIVASHVIIENCNVFDTRIGIGIWSSNNIIINCTFWGCEDEGVVLLGNTPGGCYNNVFINCVFYNCLDGIELQRSSNNTFLNCRFLSNSHAGIDGIIDNNNNNLFSSCVFYDNYFGVYFKGSGGNEFVNCTFLNNIIDVEEIKY